MADPGLEGGIDIAYAALNLTGSNALVYVATVPTFAESAALTFTTSGTSQLGPDNGGADRDLNKPQVYLPDGATVEASDILNGGLKVSLGQYSSMKAEDVITMYFHLYGQDVLMSQITRTPQYAYNVVPVIYPVKDSPLLTGNSVALTLPQNTSPATATPPRAMSRSNTRWSIQRAAPLIKALTNLSPEHNILKEATRRSALQCF